MHDSAAALAWLTRTVGSVASGLLAVPANWLQLAGKRQWLRQFHHLHGLGRIGGFTAGAAVGRRSPAAAYAWRIRRAPMPTAEAAVRGKPEWRARKPDALHSRGGFAECWRHCPSSFDQLMALT
jgi:hypothetical protein